MLGPKAFTCSPRPYRTAGAKNIWPANMGPIIAKPAPFPGSVSLPTIPLAPTFTPPTAKDRFAAALSKGKTRRFAVFRVTFVYESRTPSV